MSHNMIILYFHSTYLHVSNGALLFVHSTPSGTLLLHRRSLDTFYWKHRKSPLMIYTKLIQFDSILQTSVLQSTPAQPIDRYWQQHVKPVMAADGPSPLGNVQTSVTIKQWRKQTQAHQRIRTVDIDRFNKQIEYQINSAWMFVW